MIWRKSNVVLFLAGLFLVSCGTGMLRAADDTSGYSNAGVFVDANGVLSASSSTANNVNLTQQRIKAALGMLPGDVAAKSDLRLVSLNRLEKTIVENNGAIDDTMRYLAGILRIKYVFFYPESGDIVIGGPAEGWVQGQDGAFVGASTGRPVLELEDMIVALRTFPAGGSRAKVVGCSIDPTEEGLAKMQAFTRSVGAISNDPQAAERQKQQIMVGVKDSLGYHTIRVDGVPANTHLAQVLVAADYRMKLIGLGIEETGVRLVKYVDKADPSVVARNSLARWYFVPDYECVKMTDDRLGMEFVGNGVKLVEEAELVSVSGQRIVSSKAKNRASREFVKSFTSQYPQISQAAPVYAQLRNVIDMLVCAAHIQKEGYYEKSGWDMEFFGSEDKFAVETYKTPEKVASVVARVENVGKGLFSVPVSGGVVIEPETALQGNSAKPVEKQSIEKAWNTVRLELAEGQWWWDAK